MALVFNSDYFFSSDPVDLKYAILSGQPMPIFSLSMTTDLPENWIVPAIKSLRCFGCTMPNFDMRNLTSLETDFDVDLSLQPGNFMDNTDDIGNPWNSDMSDISDISDMSDISNEFMAPSIRLLRLKSTAATVNSLSNDAAAFLRELSCDEYFQPRWFSNLRSFTGFYANADASLFPSLRRARLRDTVVNMDSLPRSLVSIRAGHAIGNYGYRGQYASDVHNSRKFHHLKSAAFQTFRGILDVQCLESLELDFLESEFVFPEIVGQETVPCLTLRNIGSSNRVSVDVSIVGKTLILENCRNVDFFVEDTSMNTHDGGLNVRMSHCHGCTFNMKIDILELKDSQMIITDSIPDLSLDNSHVHVVYPDAVRFLRLRNMNRDMFKNFSNLVYLNIDDRVRNRELETQTNDGIAIPVKVICEISRDNCTFTYDDQTLTSVEDSRWITCTPKNEKLVCYNEYIDIIMIGRPGVVINEFEDFNFTQTFATMLRRQYCWSQIGRHTWQN